MLCILPLSLLAAFLFRGMSPGSLFHVAEEVGLGYWSHVHDFSMSVKKSFHRGYFFFLLRGFPIFPAPSGYCLNAAAGAFPLLHVAEEISSGYRRHVHDFSMSVKKSFHRGYLFFLLRGFLVFPAPSSYCLMWRGSYSLTSRS